MTPTRLRECLETLGWSAAHLAAILQVNDRTTRRWLAGEYPVPTSVAAWLERRTAAAAADPLPEGWAA